MTGALRRTAASCCRRFRGSRSSSRGPRTKKVGFELLKRRANGRVRADLIIASTPGLSSAWNGRLIRKRWIELRRHAVALSAWLHEPRRVQALVESATSVIYAKDSEFLLFELLLLLLLQFTWARDLRSRALAVSFHNRARGLDECNPVFDEDAIPALCRGRLVGCPRQPAASPFWSGEFLVARDGGSHQIDGTGVAGERSRSARLALLQ